MTDSANIPTEERRRRGRKLGEIIDALPGRARGVSPVLPLEPLPNDVLPALELPTVDPTQNRCSPEQG